MTQVDGLSTLGKTEYSLIEHSWGQQSTVGENRVYTVWDKWQAAPKTLKYQIATQLGKSSGLVAWMATWEGSFKVPVSSLASKSKVQQWRIQEFIKGGSDKMNACANRAFEAMPTFALTMHTRGRKWRVLSGQVVDQNLPKKACECGSISCSWGRGVPSSLEFLIVHTFLLESWAERGVPWNPKNRPGSATVQVGVSKDTNASAYKLTYSVLRFTEGLAINSITIEDLTELFVRRPEITTFTLAWTNSLSVCSNTKSRFSLLTATLEA